MDEILIEDKKYVSSKRAAKMTGYAKDYIGQLCREGRVPARLVGRSWYVLESAIADHRFGTTVIEPKSPVRPAPLARDIHPTWESPRYEASTSEILPSVNRLQRTETPPENLQDSWKAWFDHVEKNVESAGTAASPERLEKEEDKREEQYEEPKEEQKIEIEIEKDVQIPIHTIYELPPEELLPHKVRIDKAYPQQGDDALDEGDQPFLQEKARPRSSKVVIRTIQVAGIMFALITSTIAVIGSGYFDKYIISTNPVSILAGVGFYNR